MNGGAARFGAYLQAALEARGALLDGRVAGRDTARRLGRLLAAMPGAPSDLQRAGRRVSVGPDMRLHLDLDELLRELRRASGVARGSGVVLVVDDDPVARSMMQMVVRPYARTIQGVATLAEARKVLAEARPSALVVDVSLPDGDGRDLLVEVQLDPTLEGLPVLVLTADESPLVRAECVALGAREVHAKPMDPVLITQAMAVLLGFEERTQLELTGELVTGLQGPADLEAAAAALRERYFTHGALWSVLAVRTEAGNVAGVAEAIFDVLGLDARACRRGKAVLVVTDRDMAGAAALGKALRSRLGPGALVGGTECANSGWEEAAAVAMRMLILSQGSDDVVVVPASTVDRTRPRVVVVDDDPVVAALVAKALGDSLEVVPLADGSRLFEALDTMRPTAVILDVGLPGESGLSLLRQLRASTRHARTPVLMLSGLDQPRQVEAGLVSGADDYVTKPFSPTTLQARLRHVLAWRSRKGASA